MADISKCFGTGCQKKKECYRYTVPSGMRQSFFSAPPLNESTQECDYFWQNIDETSTVKDTYETI